MKLPSSLQVGPYTYDVLRVPDLLDADKHSLLGEADYQNLVIRISTVCPDGKTAGVFMHELLHAVTDMAGIAVDDPQNHQLAAVLLDTLQRNRLLAPCWEENDAKEEVAP